MKQSILLLLLLSATITLAKVESMPPLTLEDPILKVIDGLSIGMNGKRFRNTMRLRLNLNNRRTGEKTSAGLMGFYSFAGNKYTLQELLELEQNAITTHNEQQLQALAILLEQIKEEFIVLSDPFLADARGAKDQMMTLISEWASKAHRTNSYLLDWGASKEGNETIIVREKIKTIGAFDQFVADLIYFLETLMRSCPIAAAQFKELMQQQQNSK